MNKNKSLTISEVARMGGEARWAKISKKDRSEAMKKVRNSYPHLKVATSKHVG